MDEISSGTVAWQERFEFGKLTLSRLQHTLNTWDARRSNLRGSLLHEPVSEGRNCFVHRWNNFCSLSAPFGEPPVKNCIPAGLMIYPGLCVQEQTNNTSFRPASSSRNSDLHWFLLYENGVVNIGADGFGRLFMHVFKTSAATVWYAAPPLLRHTLAMRAFCFSIQSTVSVSWAAVSGVSLSRIRYERPIISSLFPHLQTSEKILFIPVTLWVAIRQVPWATQALFKEMSSREMMIDGLLNLMLTGEWG